ncbi:MAG: alpha/beta hydrolase [bacterium]|nr:alpha/beta hydrolase [bacterium]
MILRTPLLALLCLAACASTPKQDVESFCPAPDGMLLSYRQIGDGGDVLVVPGASVLAEDVMRLAKGRTVVFYDLRGRGRSNSLPPELPPTLKEDVDDLEVLREWLGLERFSILAHDYQASVAAHYAAFHPERVERLVLVSPVPLRRVPYFDVYRRVYNDRLDKDAFRNVAMLQRQLAHRRDPEAYAVAVRDAMFSGWVSDPAAVGRMRGNPMVEPNADPERVIAQYMNTLGRMGDWDWRPALELVQCPALVVHGAQDPVPARSSKEWADTIPAGRELVVERSSRMPWIEQPRVFFDEAESFLQSD